MNNLATIYQYGAPSVDQDPLRAKKLYEDAITNRNTEDLYGLGRLLGHGAPGVAQNVVRANELYRNAIAKGITKAPNRLILLNIKGAPEADQESFSRTASWSRTLYEKRLFLKTPSQMASTKLRMI